MKIRTATREKRWPIERLKFYDVFMLQCGWDEPRTRHPSALRSIMTEADFKLAWEENREEVMKLCEEPGPYHCRHRVCSRPGTRPQPWYDYEAPGERRQIRNPEFQAPRYGMLPSQIEWLDEPELEFLERWGLLSPKEKRLLERRESPFTNIGKGTQKKESAPEVVEFGRRQQNQEQREDDGGDDEDNEAKPPANLQ